MTCVPWFHSRSVFGLRTGRTGNSVELVNKIQLDQKNLATIYFLLEAGG
jgi:hypothetical protein